MGFILNKKILRAATQILKTAAVPGIPIIAVAGLYAGERYMASTAYERTKDTLVAAIKADFRKSAEYSDTEFDPAGPYNATATSLNCMVGEVFVPFTTNRHFEGERPEFKGEPMFGGACVKGETVRVLSMNFGTRKFPIAGGPG